MMQNQNQGMNNFSNNNNNNMFNNINFNVSQNNTNTNNANTVNNNPSQGVKEEKPQEQKNTGLSSLLDKRLVNLDSLGPKRQNRPNNNDYNNYW